MCDGNCTPYGNREERYFGAIRGLKNAHLLTGAAVSEAANTHPAKTIHAASGVPPIVKPVPRAPLPPPPSQIPHPMVAQVTTPTLPVPSRSTPSPAPTPIASMALTRAGIALSWRA